MKKLLLTMIFSLLFCCGVNADTIINVPIDSRPISSDYLENLAEIGRDDYISVDKRNMDFFSSYEPDNHLGNSKEIRKELLPIVKENNNAYTTVIINTSTYITNGLVGSRCNVNYNDYKEALEDLRTLVETNKNPRYYINMPMPRALSETRFNKIWPDNEKLQGLGWYYAKANPEAEDSEAVLKTYGFVTPEQLLMEYGYVEGKAMELGGYTRLTSWERAFINHFNSAYKTKDPYKAYVEDYKAVYENCADIFKYLVDLKKEGLIDEIIVSNDDLQLPASIGYFAEKGVDWVQREEGSPVKYSLARVYSKIAPTSIARVIRDTYGAEELAAANSGRSKYVNIINGTDEVPQLIYARDYTKRKNITPKYNIINNKVNEAVSAYDVKRAGTVAKAAIAFASGNVGIYTDKPVNMYIYDYASEGNSDYIVSQIKKSVTKGNHTALIELFSSNKSNYIFEKLLASDYISKLSAYSAWNTNGNAIGLGIAQAQVFSVASEKSNSPSDTAKAQAEMLLQHFIEDGVYTSRVKRELSNEGYRPNVEDREHSQMLYDRLEPDRLVSSLKGQTIEVKGTKYKIDRLTVNKTSFPWGRTFDILVQSQAEVKPVR